MLLRAALAAANLWSIAVEFECTPLAMATSALALTLDELTELAIELMGLLTAIVKEEEDLAWGLSLAASHMSGL